MGEKPCRASQELRNRTVLAHVISASLFLVLSHKYTNDADEKLAVCQLVDHTWYVLNDLAPVSKLARRGASLLFTMKPAFGLASPAGLQPPDAWSSEWHGDDQKVLQRVQQSFNEAPTAASPRPAMSHTSLAEDRDRDLLDFETNVATRSEEPWDLSDFLWFQGDEDENSSASRQMYDWPGADGLWELESESI